MLMYQPLVPCANNTVNNPKLKCLRVLHCMQSQQRHKKWGAKTKEKCVWRMVRRTNCTKGETQRDWMSAMLRRACLDFSTPEKRFVRFRVGSAHTAISLHIHTALCHSHEGTMCLRARMADSERKYAIVRKCNPLTVLERPLETPTCYIHTHACPLAVLLGGISEILHCHCGHLCCSDFMVNKYSRRKPPISFSVERQTVWVTPEPFFMASPCFGSHSTFHLSRRHLSHLVPVFHCNQGSYYLKSRTHQQHRLYITIWLTIACNHLTENLNKWVSGNVIPDHLLPWPNLKLVMLTLGTRLLWVFLHLFQFFQPVQLHLNASIHCLHSYLHLHAKSWHTLG